MLSNNVMEISEIHAFFFHSNDFLQPSAYNLSSRLLNVRVEWCVQ